MTQVAAPRDVPPWIPFWGTVSGLHPVGRSLIRVTCAGEEFRHFADNGFDARIKLILPLADTGFATLPQGLHWYEQWRALDEATRNPIRTYTVRAARPDLGEVDIDLVVHGDAGPASAWAQRVIVGDPVCILGPNARFDGSHGGVEFTVPPAGTTILLAGDETAQPAIAAILEALPATATGRAILEVPHAEDAIDLIKPVGVGLEWLVRGERCHGSPMLDCLRQRVSELFDVDSSPPVVSRITATEPDDRDAEELWEVPQAAHESGVYAWIAGEAAMVRAMRRLLVDEFGVDKACVAFMGYWRR